MLNKIILSLCLSLSNVAIAKSIALSFDDGLDPSINSDSQRWSHLFEQLKAYL